MPGEVPAVAVLIAAIFVHPSPRQLGYCSTRRFKCHSANHIPPLSALSLQQFTNMDKSQLGKLRGKVSSSHENRPKGHRTAQYIFQGEPSGTKSTGVGPKGTIMITKSDLLHKNVTEP